jgi:hypothetical protein
VERAVRELSDAQRRVLVVCRLLRPLAQHSIVAGTFAVEGFDLRDAVAGLEERGLLVCENDALEPSSVVADECMKQLSSATVRLDAARGAASILGDFLNNPASSSFYSALKLLICARESDRTITFLKAHVGTLIRRDSAQNILHQLRSAKQHSLCSKVNREIDGICDKVLAGAAKKTRLKQTANARGTASPLAFVSPNSGEVEYTYSSPEALEDTMTSSRNPNLPPAQRLAEATSALFVAFNRNDSCAVGAAYKAVEAVRHSQLVNRFDVFRADLIYSAFVGDRVKVLASANALAAESRIVENMELACLGLRNSAEALTSFGDFPGAQNLLLEARSVSSSLGYNSQTVWTDMELASLSLRLMDVDATKAYIASAEATCRTHGLETPLVAVDQCLFRCWEALVRGNIADAQRASRGLVRLVKRSETGVILWTRLATELATHRGARTRVERRNFDEVKASIGSCNHYTNEHFSLTSMLLYARGTSEHATVSEFARSHIIRLEAKGAPIWPFLVESLSSD